MVDEILESVTQWIQASFPVALTWSLVLYNWVSVKLENGMDWTAKSVKGIMDAHTPSTWVFTQRNTIPWIVKEYALEYPLTYDPSLMVFTSIGPTTVSNKFTDVVTAELCNSDGSLKFDMSSFFHNVSWTGSQAPTLYEVVLVYCLSNKLVYSADTLKAFSLNIFKADSNTVRILLSSPLMKCSFSGWEEESSPVQM